MEKLEQLNADLEPMVTEVRLTNPIVANVLDNAKIAMGLVTPAGKGDDSNRLITDLTRGMSKCDEEDNNDVRVCEDDDCVELVV